MENNQQTKIDNAVVNNNDNKQNETNKDVFNSTEKKENNVQNSQQQKEINFKLPEDFNIDQEVFGQFKEIITKHNIPSDVAQKIIDLEINMQQKILNDNLKIRESWKQETLKELGDKANEEISYAKKVLEKAGDEGLYDILDQTGLGNNKHVIKFFAKIGRMISEDLGGDGKPSKPEAKELSLEERLYPSYFNNKE